MFREGLVQLVNCPDVRRALTHRCVGLLLVGFSGMDSAAANWLQAHASTNFYEGFVGNFSM